MIFIFESEMEFEVSERIFGVMEFPPVNMKDVLCSRWFSKYAFNMLIKFSETRLQKILECDYSSLSSVFRNIFHLNEYKITDIDKIMPRLKFIIGIYRKKWKIKTVEFWVNNFMSGINITVRDNYHSRTHYVAPLSCIDLFIEKFGLRQINYEAVFDIGGPKVIFINKTDEISRRWILP